jgi:hypothetical protein
MEKIELELQGWTLVHTYRESHGSFVDFIYQMVEPRSEVCGWRKPTCLSVTTWLKESRPNSVNLEHDKDYLLAQEIVKGPDKFVKVNGEQVSPCYTQGSQIYQDTTTEHYYLVTSVAGHGSWAWPMTEADLKERAPSMPNIIFRAKPGRPRKEGG